MEPKWGHLRDLNSALFRRCAKVEQLGSSTEVSYIPTINVEFHFFLIDLVGDLIVCNRYLFV